MGAGRYRQWGRMLVADRLEKQQGKCPICNSQLFERHAVLDRYDRVGDFTPENVRALHVDCEVLVQRRRAAGLLAPPMIEAAE